MPFTSHPVEPPDPVLAHVAAVLEPVLAPLGFAPGQAGAAGGHGRVIFCRGLAHSTDGGCVDLVLELDAAPHWRIVDVRYWGLPSARWHLPFDTGGDLRAQLRGLVATLPGALA